MHLRPLALDGLHLQSTFLNDDGLAALGPMRSLKRLNLGMTNVSDASIPLLSSLTNLQSISLCDTDVTPEGIARLEKALPEATVYSGSGRDSLGLGQELMLPGEPSWAMSNGQRTVREVGKLQLPIKIVDYALFPDGGTQGLQLRDSDGSELFFCLTPECEEFFEFQPNRAYIGGFHPSSPGCRLLPLDNEELPRLIRYLKNAIQQPASKSEIDPERFARKHRIAEGLLRRLEQLGKR
jgi:hypothetical protein